jgi:hypothetical protein
VEPAPQVAQVVLEDLVVVVLDKVWHVLVAQVLQDKAIPAVLGNIYKMVVVAVVLPLPAAAAAVVQVVQDPLGSMEQLMPAVVVAVAAKSVPVAMPVVRAAEEQVPIQHRPEVVKL